MTLLNKRNTFWNIFGALHKEMTILCSAIFKCENKLKFGWENQCKVLKWTPMRERVEKVDVLGWNKFFIVSVCTRN